MEIANVIIILFLACINLPKVESVQCQWDESTYSEGACFLYNSTELTYAEAKSACESIGGVLAKVTSITQLNGITALQNARTVWIGANDIKNEGTWVWEDDSTVATELNTLWADGNPKEGTHFNCAQLRYIQIFSWLCEAVGSFLCMEKDLTTTQDPVASTSTKNDPVTINTAASTSDNSATINTATSTSDNSATINTAASTSDNSATINTATSTNDAKDTTLATTPITSFMKCGANDIELNGLLILHLCLFMFLVISV
ncbi:unnamed protein product [Lymnaea stagnalis]|uniref:C-type lectin domain-containing protein n=1 Tax=Lymnaea stagnalis TaxID=6523 RepID=A0AAV2H792_LYMST